MRCDLIQQNLIAAIDLPSPEAEVKAKEELFNCRNKKAMAKEGCVAAMRRTNNLDNGRLLERKADL
jgi:hypothetical protein